MIEDEDQDVPGALDAVSEVLRDLACSGLFDPQVFTLKDAQATSIHLAQVLKEGQGGHDCGRHVESSLDKG